MQNELYHHGVEGMSWGKRNGPPYPLNASGKAKLRAQKKAAKIGSTEGISELAFAGIAYGGTLLVGLSPVLISAGAAKIHEMKINGKLNKTLKEVAKNKTGEIDEKTGFHKKTKEMTVEEDVKAVNPGHNREIAKTNNNCVNCSMTYEMRRRGFDVTAELADTGKNGKKYTCDAFPGAKPVPVDFNGVYDKPPYTKDYQPRFKEDDRIKIKMAQANTLAVKGLNYDHAEAVINTLKTDFKGTRGSIMVQWSAGYGGHAISYEVDKKGNVSVIDSQIGKITTGEKDVTRYFARTRTTDIIRLDNVNYKPEKVKEVMK
jgi:hypothetical protein